MGDKYQELPHSEAVLQNCVTESYRIATYVGGAIEI